ncbi:MAG: pilus assembly protein PilM [Deltaproteobacteria bacterium]|nr:pilus assembly protein PilM [Deltaproteobacteria bacterium]
MKVVTLTPRSKTPGVGKNRPSTSKQAFEVLGFGHALVPPPGEGEDAAGTLRRRQGEALADLKARGLLEGDVFVTGLPGDAAAVKTLLFPFNDREKIAVALPYTLEAEISLDFDDVVWSWVQLPPKPTNSSAAPSKESEVLCAFARKEAVQEVLDLFAVHGIDPRHIELDTLVLDDLWDGVLAVNHGIDGDGPSVLSSPLTTPGGTVIETLDGAPAPAIAVVDIGHRRTSVCVMHQGQVVSAHTLLHGGADATRALAKDIGLPLDEAERGKRKEAFLEVAGAVAQFPEQHQISDVLKRAYAPIVRRLRQIVQATISSSRLRIVKIVLTGGGSKVLNLDRHLAEELNVKVARGREVGATLRASGTGFASATAAADLRGPLTNDADDGSEAAMALAYALSGLAGARTKARIDFRVGPFAWQGDYDFLRERVPALTAWAAALLVVVGVGSLAQVVALSREDDALVKKQLAVCQQITGQALESASVCRSIIQERINGTAGFQVPDHSAVDVFLEISRRLPYPAELKRKITELDITSERVRLKGTTTTYDAIDTMVEKLQGGKCFQLVEKGKARNISADVVELNITINLDCAAAPGDGKIPPPPPSPTAASLRAASSSSTPTAAATPGVPEPARLDEPAVPSVPNLDEAAAKRPGGADIEARKERLKRLREERETRRKQLLDVPNAGRPNIRERFTKPTLPLDRDGATDGEP